MDPVRYAQMAAQLGIGPNMTEAQAQNILGVNTSLQNFSQVQPYLGQKHPWARMVTALNNAGGPPNLNSPPQWLQALNPRGIMHAGQMQSPVPPGNGGQNPALRDVATGFNLPSGPLPTVLPVSRDRATGDYRMPGGSTLTPEQYAATRGITTALGKRTIPVTPTGAGTI